MDRRTLLKLLLASTSGALAGCGRKETAPMTAHVTPPKPASSRMPVVFLAHGAPTLLDDASWSGELASWGKSIPRPSALLVLSAHWVDDPITLGATHAVPLVYDFYGFPERYYQVKYPAPGAPALAERVRALLAPTGPVRTSERGLDHGAYIPLVPMYPDADVPVLQVSLPTMDPARLFALGRALAPLRDEGVLVMGSGFITHNLRAVDWSGKSPPASWATDFDAWTTDVLVRRDVDALLDYRARAPGVRQSLPTHEHFVPLIVAMGASVDPSEKVAFPITGFLLGSLTRRSAQWG